MSLKQRIKSSKLRAFNPAVNNDYTMGGEPLPFSILEKIGTRKRPLQFFRNKQWRSHLRCIFRVIWDTKTPVVVIATFYVSPPDHVKISAKKLKEETIPAALSHELFEYGMTLLNMLNKALFYSYRQIVKLDMEKYYSNRPRTVLKYMTWNDYVDLQNYDPDQTQAESLC